MTTAERDPGPEAGAGSGRARPGGRFWLFAPFAALALAALAWSAVWYGIRGRAVEEIDAWIAREAALGRRWTCPDRGVGGYPFRVEVVCPSLELSHPGGKVQLGRTLVVAQAYDPSLVKAEIAGPVRVTEGDFTLDGTWRLAEASLRLRGQAFQRFALAVQEPSFRLTGAGLDALPLSGRRLELHVRPNPGRAEGGGAFDASLSAAAAVIPGLDALIGGQEPADLATDATVTGVGDVAAPGSAAERMERWREAGGRVEIGRTALAKGPRRVEAAGEFGLDGAHRVQGVLRASANKLDGLVGSLGGGLLGALGRGARDPAPGAPAQAGQPALNPLPPLRFDNGRLYLGPLPVPGVRLSPLY